MFLLRQLTAATRTTARTPLKLSTPLTNFSSIFNRSYAKQIGRKMSADNINVKQVHQETLRHINPCARINIKTDIFLKVRAADVHNYPDGDVFIAELHGGHTSNCTATMEVKVSADEQQVDVVLARLEEQSDFHCELEVPIRANLYIDAKDSVSVKNMHSEKVCVQAVKDIKTKEINAETINLCSEEGSINCEGRLLGQQTNVETKEGGNISLDKLLGNKFSCKTESGRISTNSCYSAVSKFEAKNGSMQLKNVHNKTEVWIHKKGDLQMTGVNGNINVRSNGGSIDLQLSELNEESAIVASGVTQANINISDEIEKSTCIEMTASAGIELDDSLSHLLDCLSEDKHAFCLRQLGETNNSKLKVFVEGCDLKFGKLSWADTIRASIALSGVE